MPNLYFPIAGLAINVFVLLNFFLKDKLNTHETKLFKYIIIINFLECLTAISIIYVAYISDATLLLQLLNKLDHIFILTWIWLLYLYILSLKEKNKYLSTVNFKFSMVLNFIVTFIIVISDMTIINQGDIMNIEGAGINILYVTSCIYVIIMIGNILISKDIQNKKYTPVYVLIFLIILMLIIRSVDPSLLLLSFIFSYISLIMYTTIENPDVKLIEQLNDAVETANKANMAKSDFLSSMSHEIRTPLNAIVGLSQDMIDNKKLDESLKEDAHDIVNASNTLLEIVGNIIDISKIESSKMESVQMNYSINEIVDSVISLNETRIGDKDLKLSSHFAHDLPYELYGDKYHLKQVINNIVSNAVKYTDKGKVDVHVKCINKQDKTLLMISVQDTGRGIKQENITRLFNKFDRLDAEKNSTIEGVGLGLAITKKLVDLLGGKINVQSSFGKGSLFIISVEQQISKLNKPIEQEKLNTENIEVSKLFNKKILIVDDNKLNIKVAKRAVASLEMIIDECTSGLECIEKVKNNTYDVILMDIMMPEMDGETTLKKLKDLENFNIPVIALTADAIQGAKEKYIKAGFSNYLAKPFTKNQIEKILNKLF